MARKVTKEAIKGLLNKGLTGWERGRLLIQDFADRYFEKPSFLTDADLVEIKRGLSGDKNIRDYNDLMAMGRGIEKGLMVCCLTWPVACLDLCTLIEMLNVVEKKNSIDFIESCKPRVVTVKQYQDIDPAKEWLKVNIDRVKALFSDITLRDFIFEPFKGVFTFEKDDPDRSIKEAITQVAMAVEQTSVAITQVAMAVEQTAMAATQTAAQPTPTPTPAETLTPAEPPEPADTPTPTGPPALTATQTPEPPPTSTYTVHVVQVGETLFEIAKEYGLSVETLIAANNITDRGLVKIGQELVIPPSGVTTSEAKPTATGTRVGGGEPELDAQDTAISQTQPSEASTPTPAEPTATSVSIPSYTPVEELPDEAKASILEIALRSDESLVVKEVKIGGETDRKTILVVIETQGGQGSIADRTTLIEATTSFIYAYKGNQRLDLEAKYVLVRAQALPGDDKWYALATIDNIGSLIDGEITALTFVERMVIETP